MIYFSIWKDKSLFSPTILNYSYVFILLDEFGFIVSYCKNIYVGLLNGVLQSINFEKY